MSFDGLHNLLVRASTLSAIIPLVACFIKRKVLNATLWTLCFYLFLCLIADFLGALFATQDNIQFGVVNAFTVVECSLLCLIYHFEFKNIRWRKLLTILYLCFLCFAIIQFAFCEGFNKVDTKVSSFEALLIMAFSGIYLVKFLTEPEIKKIESYYFFWIVLANILYFATALVFFMAANFIKNAPKNVADLLWDIHNFINIACYILFTIGICQIQRK